MIKLLIADDEPLVQIGLKSMISWEELGIEICATAANGDAAYQLICEHRPEIVLTDIQMPCSSGLELGKRCREEFGALPLFILLTNYEDFQYAKEAISFQAFDYLIKIDLSPENLTATIEKAIAQVRLLQDTGSASPSGSASEFRLLQERFFIRLLNNLFETDTQYQCLLEELKIPAHYSGYAAAHVIVQPPAQDGQLSQEQMLKYYSSTRQMLTELFSKHLPCQVIPLDIRHMAVVLYFSDSSAGDWKTAVTYAFQQAFEMLFNYYSVRLLACIGRYVGNMRELSVSYYDAKQLVSSVSENSPILYWDDCPNFSGLRNVFNLSLFRKEIGKAFEELNETALHQVFSDITELLSSENVPYSQALDAAGSILHFTVTLLPNGEEIASSLFQDDPETYCSLYRQKTVPAILNWLNILENGLCAFLPEYKSKHKNYLVENTKKYIREHLHQRIVLQDLADSFEVSPNYLSQLFKKFEGVGINEYVSNLKIEKSKELLKDGNLKIYEVADRLGFESAFYFSKVFKRVTGVAPKDYRNI